MSIEDAFRKICTEAKPSGKFYVSLYVTTPYYGGPEEGGWWGHDDTLVAYQECNTEEHAEELVERITALADTLNEDSKRKFGEQCLRECEWLDARGLDADFLPEVDGHEEYMVLIEDRPGSHERRGSRHYE